MLLCSYALLLFYSSTLLLFYSYTLILLYSLSLSLRSLRMSRLSDALVKETSAEPGVRVQLKLHNLPAGLGEKVDVNADSSISGSSFTMADFVAVATTISTSTSAEARTFQLKPAFPAFRGRLAERPTFDADSSISGASCTKAPCSWRRRSCRNR